MRDYGKLAPTFWTRGPGRIFRGDHLAIAIAVYVHTCPASNMIGLYYLAFPGLCHEIGATPDDVAAALNRLAERDVVHFDRDSDLVWVPDGAAEQTAATMKPTDNRHKAVLRELATFGSHRFVMAFWDRYGSAYQLGARPGEAPSVAPYVAPSQAPSVAPSKGSALASGAPSKPEAEAEAGSGSGSRAEVPRAPAREDPPSPVDRYRYAFARGISRGADLEAPAPSGGAVEVLTAIVEGHAARKDIPLRNVDELAAWLERTAEDFARSSDDFVRKRRGLTVQAFHDSLFRSAAPAAKPGVQTAPAGGRTWKTRAEREAEDATATGGHEP